MVELADLLWQVLSVVLPILGVMLGYFLCYFYVHPFGKVVWKNVGGKNFGLAIVSNQSRRLKFITVNYNDPTFTHNGMAYNLLEGNKYFIGNLAITFFNDGNAMPIELEIKDTQTQQVADCPKCHEKIEVSVTTKVQTRAEAAYLSAIIQKIYALFQANFFRLNQLMMYVAAFGSVLGLLGVVYLILVVVPNASNNVASQVSIVAAQVKALNASLVTPIPVV